MAAIETAPNYSTLTAEFDSIAAEVATYQATFLAANKRYWQGLLSHPTQDIAATTRAMVAVTIPVDETTSWDSVSSASVLASYECDKYNGGGGLPGYILRARILYDDGAGSRTYRKEAWYGPRSDSEYSSFIKEPVV